MSPALLLAAAATGWCPNPPVASPPRAWVAPPPPPEHVHSEHTLPGDPQAAAAGVAVRGLAEVERAAWTWREGGGPQWRDRAAFGMMEWVRRYKPDLNPIDETSLDALVETEAIVDPTLSPEHRAEARAFLAAWGRAYVDSIAHAGPGAVWSNNWQSHRIKLVTMVAYATDDARLIADARRLYVAQLGANMRPDGEVIDFVQRDALHYVVYDLEPLLRAALAARAHGQDWWSLSGANGASLAAAVRWLAPYASGEKAHDEFVHTGTAFDRERAAAGVKGFAGPFDPRHAAQVMWMASVFDPDYRPLAERLGPEPEFLTRCGA